ncbi:hypothetical protein [Planktothrix tepida]|uniref:hypothetical protein n=1 Tax=Planktothrix tepida TaxID=1678309 RepID=UPI000933BA8C|nr:hypothetical protein [Planktothrix tepida]
MQLEINPKSIGIRFNNGFKIYFQAITCRLIIYKESPDSWLFPEQVFFKFSIIPDDLNFWNHALWVFPNPELISRIIPPWIDIYSDNKGGYFASDRIPF